MSVTNSTCPSCDANRWTSGSLRLSEFQELRVKPHGVPALSNGFPILVRICLDCGHLGLAVSTADLKKIKPEKGSVLGLT